MHSLAARPTSKELFRHFDSNLSLVFGVPVNIDFYSAMLEHIVCISVNTKAQSLIRPVVDKLGTHNFFVSFIK